MPKQETFDPTAKHPPALLHNGEPMSAPILADHDNKALIINPNASTDDFINAANRLRQQIERIHVTLCDTSCHAADEAGPSLFDNMYAVTAIKSMSDQLAAICEALAERCDQKIDSPTSDEDFRVEVETVCKEVFGEVTEAINMIKGLGSQEMMR